MTERWNYRFFLKWAVALSIFALLGKMVWENWNQVKEASFTFRLLPFVVSTLLFVLSYFVQIWAWYLITLKCGVAIPIGETIESWLYSQMGKYLPGKVWLLLGRFYFYQSRGRPKGAITAALYFETVTMVTAAGLIFFFSFFISREARFLPQSPLWPGLLLTAALFFLHPKILQRILNVALRLLRRRPLSLSISYSAVLQIQGVCILSWAVGGIGFSLFVHSVFPVSARVFFFLAGALAISSTVGLLALFAPSGLGVREGILVYLLSTLMPSSIAVILSVLTRLWMTLIEIGMIGMVYLVGRFRKRMRERTYV